MQLLPQRGRNSCNVACIQMILDHFAIQAPVRDELNVHAYGNTVVELESYLHAKGLVVELITPTAQLSDGIFLAGVTRVTRGKATPHYVVIERHDDNNTIYDPSEKDPYNETITSLIQSSQQAVQKQKLWLRVHLL